MPSFVDIHAHGGELSLTTALDVGDTELRQASLDQRGHDLLIETPEDLVEIEQRLQRLRERGYRITLTHPERRREFQASPERLEQLSDGEGVLVAVDADSLLSAPGAPERVLAERLCRDGRAHLLALDSTAEPDEAVLAQGETAAGAIVGEARARWLVADAPAAIVAGTALPPMPEAAPAGESGSPAESEAIGQDAPARLPLRARISRTMLLVPLLAVAVISFVVIRSQHDSGATVLTQQRAGEAVTGTEVARLVRSAPDPTTHLDAIQWRCAPLGTGNLHNPWRCTLRYANGDLLQYTVTVAADGSYVGTDQITLAPPPRRPTGGSISGCCIKFP
jgi:hypothetical protein